MKNSVTRMIIRSPSHDATTLAAQKFERGQTTFEGLHLNQFQAYGRVVRRGPNGWLLFILIVLRYMFRKRRLTSDISHSVTANHTLSSVLSVRDTYSTIQCRWRVRLAFKPDGYTCLDYQGNFSWHKGIGLFKIWSNKVWFIGGVNYFMYSSVH